jgi:hypothetical protein
MSTEPRPHDPPHDPQKTLAWEAAWRGRAGLATLGAAVGTIVGTTISALGIRGAPGSNDKTISAITALRDVSSGTRIPPGRLSADTAYIGHHAAAPIAGAIVLGLGSLLVFAAMAYLFRAARARRPGLSQAFLVLAAIGAVLFGVGNMVAGISRFIGASHYPGAAGLSNKAAADALTPNGFLVGQVILQAGALALGFSFVVICLNAMRVGLLNRFMGFLGIIVGVTFVLPLDQQGILRTFWLAAAGALILGRWPNGVPKAWATGNAEPWPTQQQLREERDAARAKTKPAPAPAPSARTPPPRRPEPVTSAPSPATSRKKKRKRRA